MNIKRYDCSPGVDGYMSEDADGEYVRHEDIAAVLKDAERYRWLRGKHNDKASTIVVMNDQEMLEDLADIPGDALDLDAAIDAVMQGANA